MPTVTNTDSNLSGDTLLTAENSDTITGLKTFDRDPNAPFAVSAASAVVTNLDSDKLDGQEGSFYTTASNLSSGTIPAARLGLLAADIAHSDANFTGSGGDSDWVVASGDQLEYYYLRIGELVVVFFTIGTSTVANAPATLRITLPVSAVNDARGVFNYSEDGGTNVAQGQMLVAAGSSLLVLSKNTGSWSNTTNLTSVTGQFMYITSV